MLLEFFWIAGYLLFPSIWGKILPKASCSIFFPLRGGDRFQGFTCARQALSYQASWFFFRTKMEHFATGFGGQWAGAYKLDHLDFASVVKFYRDICGNSPCARPVGGSKISRHTAPQTNTGVPGLMLHLLSLETCITIPICWGIISLGFLYLHWLRLPLWNSLGKGKSIWYFFLDCRVVNQSLFLSTGHSKQL